MACWFFFNLQGGGEQTGWAPDSEFCLLFILASFSLAETFQTTYCSRTVFHFVLPKNILKFLVQHVASIRVRTKWTGYGSYKNFFHGTDLISQHFFCRLILLHALKKKKVYDLPFSGLVITLAASISNSCFWISKERGCNMQRKNKSDFSKNDLWLCLQINTGIQISETVNLQSNW